MDRTIKTRAMTGSLYGQVPSAAMDDVSDEDGGQSDPQLGGYAVEEPDGASPHGSELESGDDGSYALTVDSRLGRAAADNPGRNRTPSGGGVQASATAAAGVNSAVTTSAALESSTQSLARQQPPAHSPSGPKPRSNPHQGKVVFDKEAPTIDATLSRLRQGGALAVSKRNRRAR